MIWQIFSPGKVFSCCPSIVWREEQLGAWQPAIAVPTSSNKQGLFEMQKIIGQHVIHLLAAGEKGCAAMVISRCGQVGKGTHIFAFRVVPGSEKGRWQWWFEHLSTFPWPPLTQPPIVTNPVRKATAHVPLPPFRRVSCFPPESKGNVILQFVQTYLLLFHRCWCCCSCTRQWWRSQFVSV